MEGIAQSEYGMGVEHVIAIYLHSLSNMDYTVPHRFSKEDISIRHNYYLKSICSSFCHKQSVLMIIAIHLLEVAVLFPNAQLV